MKTKIWQCDKCGANSADKQIYSFVGKIRNVPLRRNESGVLKFDRERTLGLLCMDCITSKYPQFNNAPKRRKKIECNIPPTD